MNLFTPELFAKNHTLFTAGTQMGKSSLAYSLFQMLHAPRHASYILLDGKGSLYDSLLAYCCAVGVNKHKFFCVDPRDEKNPTLNPLEPIKGVDPSVTASNVLDAMKTMFKEEELQLYLEQYLPIGLAPLSAAGYTLLDAQRFFSPSDTSFRRRVLAEANIPYCTERWREFEETITKPAEREERLKAVNTRLALLLRSPFLQRVFSTPTSTLSIPKFLNTKGSILLARLGLTNATEPKTPEFLGALLLNLINTHARDRKEKFPVYVICDEFQKFLGSGRKVADMLEQLLGMGVSFILIHQLLGQLAREDESLTASVLANTNVKIVGGCSHDDAEILRREIFAGHHHKSMQEPKDVRTTIKYRLNESVRAVKTVTRGGADGWAESETASEMSGGGEGYTTTAGKTASLVPFEGELTPVESESSGESFSSSATWALTSGTTSARSWTENWSESVSMTPFLEHIPYEEITSKTFPSYEEVATAFREALQTLKPRSFIVSVRGLKPQAFRSPDVRLFTALPSQLARLKRAGYDAINRLPLPKGEAAYAPKQPKEHDDDFHYGQPKRNRRPK